MSKEYDKQIGRDIDDRDYCDICGDRLVTTMEQCGGRCSDCMSGVNCDNDEFSI